MDLGKATICEFPEVCTAYIRVLGLFITTSEREFAKLKLNHIWDVQCH